MASAAQIAANIENAKQSTGPRTEEGKAAAAVNGMTHGLYARKDFIRPKDEPDYVKLQSVLQTELNPAGIQEQTLVDEIRRAIWRLRRCGEVEARLVIRLGEGGKFILDPMENFDEPERIQNSVDRARSQSHRLLHKCTAELHKLQTARQIDASQTAAAQSATTTRTQSAKNADTPGSPLQVVPDPPPATTMQTQSGATGTPRNALCPCGSGQKHKRCCGRTAPAILHAASSAA